MARAVATLGLLIGALAIWWGVAWINDPPESFGRPYGIGLVVFGVIGLYSGFTVIRRGRL